MPHEVIYIKSNIAGAQKIETVDGPAIILPGDAPIPVYMTREIEFRLARRHISRYTSLTVKKKKGPRRLRR